MEALNHFIDWFRARAILFGALLVLTYTITYIREERRRERGAKE